MTAVSPAGGGHGRMSIGEVLNRLRPEFPEVSISKIRFLEAEGLVEPERTPSGYRKFSYSDLERLRYILTQQRDRYFPLKVIREHLDAMERGLEPPTSAGDVAKAPRAVQAVPDELDPRAYTPSTSADLRMSADELVANSGLTREQLDELVSFGLVKPRAGTRYYDADALAVATVAAQLTAYGLEPRHLRAFKTAADREVGLIEQVVSPHSGGRDETAQARADEMVAELAALSVRLHAALMKCGLRRTR